VTIDCSLNWPEIGRVAGPCIRPGGPVLTDRALKICSLPPGSFVADIGCGAGGTLEHLERTGVYHTVGLDCSGPLLGESVPRLESGRLVHGMAETLPFKKGSLDALFCECVLSILSDKTTALLEFVRVLRAGGFLIISDVFRQGDPDRSQPEMKLQGLHTRGLFAKEDLLGILTRLGFAVLLWEERERLLKEFVARMILAGVRLPDPWGCWHGQDKNMSGHPRISYFLLVARKPFVSQSKNNGYGESWTI
jgi:arsenite methyltransferase